MSALVSELSAQARQAASVARHLVRTLGAEHPPGAVGRAIFEAGHRSLGFLLLTQAFLGAIFTLQAGFQAQRILGDTSLVGPQSIPLLVRLTGPTLTGLMLAARVGTGIAAEIGGMVVTEQVDALRLCGADPVPWLLKARVWAGLIVTPALTLLGTAAAIGAGALTAQAVFGTPPSTFLRFDAVGLVDLVEGLLKSLAAGLAVPVLAGAAGLAARGGSEGVGEATTRAVVHGSLAVIALDFALGGLVFVVAR